VSTKEPTVTDSPIGVSVDITPEPAVPAASVADVTVAHESEDSGGLGVGLMVLLVFTVTILTALADTAFNGSITWITGVVFVVISVIAAAAVGYRDLSTTIITPPLAYFTAILIAGQPDLLDGATDNLLIREGAMVVAGLAFNAPWIFAGTGAAALIVIVRRWILHR
jgi:hypothetical protein